MSYVYPYSGKINLYVKARINESQALRQTETARAILRRLTDQPGVILADEVGMGKTFVALAVATSIVLSDPKKRPVVVMVPPSLREKWPRDFQLFREKCLSDDLKETLSAASANTAVDYLKLLDDPPRRRRSLIFLTHGAMSRQLSDAWVKLAVIRKALRYRNDAKKLRRALCKVMGKLLHMTWIDNRNPELWEALLLSDTKSWLSILRSHGIDPEHDNNPDTDDDPVPETVEQALDGLNADGVYEALKRIPFRQTANFEKHMKEARRVINEELKRLWDDCIRTMRYSLPLLILDEAHHLKNPQTKLASLFQDEEAKKDVEEINRGPLGGVFERMLFLTATPFQLGHHELCSILDRFGGISWKSQIAPAGTREGFSRQMIELKSALNEAQEAALRLDNAWGLLRTDDLVEDKEQFDNIDDWWTKISVKANAFNTLSIQAQHAVRRFEEAKKAMRVAEELLKPWVVRHIKSKTLMDFPGVTRRQRFDGRAILAGVDGQDTQGLDIKREAVLPFLLAARATTCAPNSRPLFAEGLASCYEAFLQTRKKNGGCSTDADHETIEPPIIDDVGRWYLDRLQEFLPLDDTDASVSHPKVSATINRTIAAWKTGEKVLIFCHYIVTGRILRQLISHFINREIVKMGAQQLGCPSKFVFLELDRIGKRFFDTESPIRMACDHEIQKILTDFPKLRAFHHELIVLIRRYIRTPSFLVRYFSLQEGQIGEDSMVQAFDKTDGSGLTLRQILRYFFIFLDVHCSDGERKSYIGALDAIQTGSISGKDASKTFSEDEIQGDRTEKLVPNVRLVNGATKQESRQRLMLTFNTPFYPEILVASSVMAEGVDLHLNCREVIHHDLCWNPSTLEQRTGRVDRIGSKGERCGNPISVYLPYIGGTQDEKMYRVVMDRERWFKVVMGEQFKVDARTTDRMADRLPLPRKAAEDLAFRLEVVES